MGGKEPRRLYRAFFRPSTVAAARRCRDENAVSLLPPSGPTAVPAGVVTAILFVETSCGRNTGFEPRCSTASPDSRWRTSRRTSRTHRAFRPARRRRPSRRRSRGARARELEDTFYTEVRAGSRWRTAWGASLRSAARRRRDRFPAFSSDELPQVGADAVATAASTSSTRGSAASCANYLAKRLAPGASPAAGRRDVIWALQHSTPISMRCSPSARELDHPASVRRTRRDEW